MRLVQQVRHWGQRQGDAPAVQWLDAAGQMGGELTYAQLAHRIAAVAATLSRDIAPGGVVLLAAPNGPDWIAAYLGILAAGGVVFPLPAEAVADELHRAARRAHAAGVLATPRVLDALQSTPLPRWPVEQVGTTPPPPAIPAAPSRAPIQPTAAMLLQSSGTTGLPKIVRREQAALDAVAENMVHAIGFTPEDIVLATLPLCHSYGVEHGLLAPLWAGSCVRFTHAFDPPVVLKQLQTAGITIFPAVPFMYEILAGLGEPGTGFPTLRRAYSAGGALPASVRQAFEHRYGAPVTQLYGASEIGSVTFARAEAPGFDPAGVGAPMRGVSIKILDIDTPDIARPLPPGAQGQIAVCAPSMMSGYLEDQPAPILHGHFLTGDLGHLDAHGALVVTGRLKLLIDVGGLKVNPLEIETVLMQHPGVAECVVLPMPVTQTVSRLKAVIVPRDGQTPSPETLRAFVKQRLSAYKVPRVFELRPSLPKSATGKLLRNLIQPS